MDRVYAFIRRAKRWLVGARATDQDAAGPSVSGRAAPRPNAADQAVADDRDADERAADQAVADDRDADERAADQAVADERAAADHAADHAADERAADQAVADQRAAAGQGATDESGTRERRRSPLNEALVLETDSDPLLTRVGNADISPADVPVETGLTPKEYVEYAISAGTGRLTREALLDHTGWLPRVADRLLSEMEDERRLVCVSRGRITLVCLPDAVPNGRPREKDRGEPVDDPETPRHRTPIP